MKLKTLREHYQSTGHGVNWVPKISYESMQAIVDAGFCPNLWRYYVCSICSQWHKARKK